ncbi:MAG TPA: hypothetical protein VGU20_24120 [Stellaceae bacterium]|nr:hypothetical protein [Stellaceae bacterium]
MELGWPLPKRRDMIRRLAEGPATETYRLRFQGRSQVFPIRRVPLGFPKYRLDNGRTQAAQAEYLATHPELSVDFFSHDLESIQTHRVQHDLLKRMIQDDGDKDLLRFFTSHEQDQPFILSDDGFVINGNRRLCALRELYESSRADFAKFEDIDVVFLPPADARDIDRLEAILQITEDIKATYSWTATAFMLRKRRDEHRFTEEELSQLYELSETDIRELLDMLSLAESYLEDRGITKQYGKVEKSEYAFRQLLKMRRRFKTEPEKEVFERIAYCLIDQPTAAGGRVYAAIPDVREHFEHIIPALQEHIKPPKNETASRTAVTPLLGGQPSPLLGLAEALSDKKNYGKTRDVVTEVIATRKSIERETKKENAAISLIGRALSLLSDASMAISEGASTTGILGDLDKLTALVQKLRSQINGKA